MLNFISGRVCALPPLLWGLMVGLRFARASRPHGMFSLPPLRALLLALVVFSLWCSAVALGTVSGWLRAP